MHGTSPTVPIENRGKCASEWTLRQLLALMRLAFGQRPDEPPHVLKDAHLAKEVGMHGLKSIACEPIWCEGHTARSIRTFT